MALFNPPDIDRVLLVSNNAGGRSITGFGAAFTGTAGTALVFSVADSTGTAAGTDITVRAGAASTSGSGGNLILRPGNSAGGGANVPGTVQIYSASSGTAVGAFASTGVGIFSIQPTGGITNIEFSISGASTAVSFNVSMVTSSVNYIQVAGATTTNHPIISAQGETNVDITMTPKGTGDVVISAGGLRIAAGRIQGLQGADVASASTIALSEGNAFELTGTTAVTLITSTGWQDGSQIVLIANENVTITHGTATSGADVTILLAGAGNFAMTANDTLTLMLCSTTANGQAWRECSRTAI